MQILRKTKMKKKVPPSEVALNLQSFPWVYFCLSDMLNGARLRYSSSPLIAAAIYLFPDMLRKKGAETSFNFAENSLLGLLIFFLKKKKKTPQESCTSGS